MRILILTASTGGGHKRAAAAIRQKIGNLNPECTVNVVDALKEAGRLYDDTVCKGYHFMATKIPKVYGLSYKITDRKTPIYKAVTSVNQLISRKLVHIINEYNPDVIISCHPFVTTMLSKLKEKGYVRKEKVIALITDYDSHRTYIYDNIDAYVTAEPQMESKLVDEYGLDKSKIYSIGIPTFDSFAKADFDRAEICRREGLDPNKRTILLMAGSFGVTNVLEFYKGLAQKPDGLQFIVITGNNKKLYEHMEKLVAEMKTGDITKLLFFVDNVQDYMHISDMIVTKPGGLTVTESLVCGLPIAVYSAFPGQEHCNAMFLVNSGAAVLLDRKHGARTVTGIIHDPERLGAMKQACRTLAKPNAAEDIYNLALKLYEQR